MTKAQKILYGVLKKTGRQVLKELIVTFCAEDQEVLTKVRLQRVTLRTENYVLSLPFFYFFVFKLTLFLFQYALPPLSWKLTPFTKMSLERRLRYLGEWQSSNFYYKRLLFKLLSLVCVSHLYSEEKLLISLGYELSMKHRVSR